MNAPSRPVRNPLDDLMATPAQYMVEVVLWTKASGALTKRISLGPDGKTVSDGSECVMCNGTAVRAVVSLQGFKPLIERCTSAQAISLGSLRPDLPDERLNIVTKGKWNKLKDSPGVKGGTVICRTTEFVQYMPRMGLSLFDFDSKGMPKSVDERIEALGGLWPALCSVLPELAVTAHIDRPSTSTGLSNAKTGETYPGSRGIHIYPLLTDISDNERFLRRFHDRCWLVEPVSLGWMMLGRDGSFLSRSIVDRMVYGPERLSFEGAPVLDEPLVQDKERRAATVYDGLPLDSKATILDLTSVEKAKLAALTEAEKRRLKPQADTIRHEYIQEQAAEVSERTGCSMPIAREIIERKISGDLLPSIVLEWDDVDLAGCMVSDVLADPDKFVGETLADPAEGVTYGRGKAKIMRRADGSTWINSFAHGHHAYELKYDAAMVTAAILAATEAEAANILVSMLPRAVVNKIELDELKQIACKRSGARPRALDNRIKEAEQKAKADARDGQEPRDGRVVLPAPTLNAERLPVVTDIDEVLCDTRQPIPPMRDRKGIPIKVVIHSPEIMHRLTTAGMNAQEKPSKRLAAPPQPVLVPHSKVSMAQLIERHVAFQVTNKDGETSLVALHPIFVEHYMEFEDSRLPKARGIMTAPVVLLDGTLLAPDRYHPPTQLIFMIDPALRSYLPRPEECTKEEAAKSLQFLTDDWLCDVATTFEGKCAATAYSMTIIERTMFDKRPMWLGDAPSRGGGKTTLAVMLNLAATGRWPSAVAYSPNPEERRKAMMSVLIAGPEAVMWDNVKAGTVISCSSFERASTNPIYSDRELSKTNNLEAYAYPPQMVNGNNISAGGEVASRTLKFTLDAKRPDPEKRAFKHPDPIGWTLDHRGEILRHFYILLMANPAAKPGSNEQNKTRFPDWWRTVGAALEHAAKTLVEQQSVLPEKERTATLIDFAKMISEAEQDNADNRDHACVLAALRDTYGTEWFTSAMISAALKADAEQARVDADKAKADGKAKDAGTPSDRPIDIIRGYFEKNLRRGTSLSPSNITSTFAPILGARVYEGAGNKSDNYRRMHVEREEHTAANKVIRFRVVVEVGDPDKPDDVCVDSDAVADAKPSAPPPASSPDQESAPRPAVNGFAGANVVMEVFYKAAARFGDDTARANEWMQTEQPALGMRRPDQVCSVPDGVALCLAALAKAAV